MTKQTKVKYACIFVLLFALLLVCVSVFAKTSTEISAHHAGYEQAQTEYNDIRELLVTKDKDTNKTIVNFDDLRFVNDDVIAWVSIDNTTLNYPIVQSDDNSYYLRRTLLGKDNAAGTIFLDYRNKSDFTSNYSIIYGHKMLDDSMFACLTNYKEQDFYNQHKTINLYTPDKDYIGHISSAFVVSATDDIYSLEFDDFDMSNSLITTYVDVKADDKILILSTCDYNGSSFDDSKRMIVVAVLKEVS